MLKIKPLVFLPPFLLCAAVVHLNFADEQLFGRVMTSAYQWVLPTFGWLVSLLAFCMLVLCGIIYASPFGRTVIGGPDAKPLLTKWQMFAVVLTTNLAIGVLFWGPVEPLTYLSNPPPSAHAEPYSPEAALFSISTVYLHWTSTPYAIATIVGLMFGFTYYNMKKPFSLGAPLSPLLGSYGNGRLAQVIDAICLYALVAAMAAALGGASMLLGGGVNYMLGIKSPPSNLLLAVIMAAIVVMAVVNSISGITKGIRIVAGINTSLLIAFLAMILVLGPTVYVLSFAVEGFGYFLNHYFEKILFTGAAHHDVWPRIDGHREVWPQKWTQMHFSAWFAWAPIMGVFLGRISRGYTVRSFIVFNALLPAVFTGIWMAIFCGTILHMQLREGADLAVLLDPNDPTKVLYPFLERLPFTEILVPVLLITSFLSMVTTVDSNTHAMSSISSTGISPEDPDSSMFVKITWGLVMGLLSWIMVADARLDGVRRLSSLGGFPALFLCLAISICAIRVMLNPTRYNRFPAERSTTQEKNEQERSDEDPQ
ncbi:MAG: BCCT family transporter [Verrucomicrobia bacterium]|nr:BCCT family transporter [Verrucomicrobiota bacterium]